MLNTVYIGINAQNLTKLVRTNIGKELLSSYSELPKVLFWALFWVLLKVPQLFGHFLKHLFGTLFWNTF